MSQEITIKSSTSDTGTKIRCFLDVATVSSSTSNNTKISISLKVEVGGGEGHNIGKWHEQGSVSKGTSTYIKVEATKGKLFNPKDSKGRPTISTNKEGNKEQTFYFSGYIPNIGLGVHTIKTCNFYLEHDKEGKGSIKISSLWNIISTWGNMSQPKIKNYAFSLDTLNSKADFASSVPSKIYTSSNTDLEIQIKKPVNAKSTSVSLKYGTTTLTPSSSAMTFSNWKWIIPATTYTNIPFSPTEKEKTLTLTITTNFSSGTSQSSSKNIILVLSSKPTINSISINKLYYNNVESSLTGTYGDSNKYRVINLPSGGKYDFKYSININATGSQDKISGNSSTSEIKEYKINNSPFTQNGKISLKSTSLTASVKDNRNTTAEKTFDLSKTYTILEYIPVTKYLLEPKGFFEVAGSGTENPEGTIINNAHYNLKFNFSCNLFLGILWRKWSQ